MISRILPRITMLIALLVIGFCSGHVFSTYIENVKGDRAEDTHLIMADTMPEAVITPVLSNDFLAVVKHIFSTPHGLIDGLIIRDEDVHTKYVEPAANELANDYLRGYFGVIGAYLDYSEFGFFLQPMRGLMAEQVGIQYCDFLLAIDGVSLTPDNTVDEVSALIRGEINTVVNLRIRRVIGNTDSYTEGQQCPTDHILRMPTKDLAFTVTRTKFEVPSMKWYILSSEDTLYLPDNIKIGYIKHDVFSERSATDMHLALNEMLEAGADRFIWDLRGNPGGLVDIAIELADIWLADGTVMREKGAYNQVWEPTAVPGGIGEGYPVTLLVDGGSASASEIIAGAFQDHGRGPIVGTPTYGKGSVQYVFQLSDGGSRRITDAEFFTPMGRKVNGQPLQPDKLTQPDVDPLQEAIKIAIDDRSRLGIGRK